MGEERLADLLVGPTALTFVRGDTAAAAKAITTFNKEHDVLTYKGGFMGETVLDEAAFKSIAQLPSREVLIGQFAGVVASPLTGMVRGLNALIQGLATQLGQIAEQGLVTGEAPAAAPAARRRGGPAAEETRRGARPRRPPPRSRRTEARARRRHSLIPRRRARRLPKLSRRRPTRPRPQAKLRTRAERCRHFEKIRNEEEG